MSTIKTTFESIWKQGLEADATGLGVIDGDLAVVRAKVKNLFISAGWTLADGTVEFVSDLDCANALQAANKELNKVAPLLAAERRVANINAAAAAGAPTKAGVLSARTNNSLSAAGGEESCVDPQQVTLQSTGDSVSAAAFAPKMGQIGDPCPRCNGSMTPVALANNQPAIYCTRDRVITPLSSNR